MPETIRIGQLCDDRLRLIRPISLAIETEVNSVAVTDDFSDSFGSGEYLTEAIEDYQRCMVELYWTLNDETQRLGPAMIELRDALNLRIRRVA